MIRVGYFGDPADGRKAVEWDFALQTVTTFTDKGAVESLRPMTAAEVSVPAEEVAGAARSQTEGKARADAAAAVAALVDDPTVDAKLRAALAALAGVVAPGVKVQAEALAGKPIDVVAEAKVT